MDLGFWLIFGAGALVGGAIAVLLLWVLALASGADEDAERGDYRAGGGWG